MQKEKKEETYSYRGWLQSDAFLKRALATLGYVTVARLVIAAPIILLVIIITLIMPGDSQTEALKIGFGNELVASQQKGFIEGCNGGSLSEEACACVAEKLFAGKTEQVDVDEDIVRTAVEACMIEN
jgi:hypothetical protein